MRIVAFAGSLRKASFNRSLLFALGDVAPPGLAIEIHSIRDIPLFNQDDEAEGTPPAVQQLRDAIAAADGLLVATPEYNAGVPGVLKNAIDWLSRPPGRSVLAGKPTAVLGVTPGQLGTARAQAQLRAAFEFSATPVMPAPQVYVGQARDKFDAEGRLTDEKTRAFLEKFLEAFSRWIERNR
jgi:chromate reductase